MAADKKQHNHSAAYKTVWLTLLVLTVITVWVAYHDFGVFNIAVAMLIATVKASLVCLYFMHLKYDNRTNQVVFASSIVFLGIFVCLTATDELVRPMFAAAEVTPIKRPEGMEASQMEVLRKPSDALIAKGKELYMVQCMTCHGAEGKGDGPAAAALKPVPRNFTSGEWKLGGTPAQVFTTLTNGIPGTSMAAFGTLSVEDRWALVHYVRSLSPNTPEDTDETLAAAGMGAAPAGKAPKLVPELPVQFAIDRLVEEAK